MRRHSYWVTMTPNSWVSVGRWRSSQPWLVMRGPGKIQREELGLTVNFITSKNVKGLSDYCCIRDKSNQSDKCSAFFFATSEQQQNWTIFYSPKTFPKTIRSKIYSGTQFRISDLTEQLPTILVEMHDQNRINEKWMECRTIIIVVVDSGTEEKVVPVLKRDTGQGHGRGVGNSSSWGAGQVSWPNPPAC